MTIRANDEGLTLETSAFQSLYGGQFTLLTPLINQILVYHSPTDAALQFLQKPIPLTYSTDYYQQITLESCFTDLEQTALNRCQRLLAHMNIM